MNLLDYSAPTSTPIFDYEEDDMDTCGSTMQVTNASVSGWTITSFAEVMNRQEPSYDRVYVHDSGLGLQLGVIDGALNTMDARHPVKTRAAIETTVSSISMFGLAEGLSRAAAAIHDPAAVNKHRNPTLAFAGVEIANSKLRVYRNGDCVAWVRSGGFWTEILPGDMLTLQGREAYESAIAANAPSESGWAVQERVLEDEKHWAYPPLGHAPFPQSKSTILEEQLIDELVLASDGADVDASRLEDISDWMTRGRHERAVGNTLRFPHGDLSLIWARRKA